MWYNWWECPSNYPCRSNYIVDKCHPMWDTTHQHMPHRKYHFYNKHMHLDMTNMSPGGCIGMLILNTLNMILKICTIRSWKRSMAGRCSMQLRSFETDNWDKFHSKYSIHIIKDMQCIRGSRCWAQSCSYSIGTPHSHRGRREVAHTSPPVRRQNCCSARTLRCTECRCSGWCSWCMSPGSSSFRMDTLRKGTGRRDRTRSWALSSFPPEIASAAKHSSAGTKALVWEK